MSNFRDSINNVGEMNVYKIGAVAVYERYVVSILDYINMFRYTYVLVFKMHMGLEHVVKIEKIDSKLSKVFKRNFVTDSFK